MPDVGDYVVYPKHGVGRSSNCREERRLRSISMFCASRRNATLRVPVSGSIDHAQAVERQDAQGTMETLKGKPKIKRTMGVARRNMKINSGEIVLIAEVTQPVPSDDQPEQSYSNARSSKPLRAARTRTRGDGKQTSRPHREDPRRAARTCAAVLGTLKTPWRRFSDRCWAASCPFFCVLYDPGNPQVDYCRRTGIDLRLRIGLAAAVDPPQRPIVPRSPAPSPRNCPPAAIAHPDRRIARCR